MIAHVLPYARARLTALGYKEWSDSFSIENMPRSLHDTHYHLEMGVFTVENRTHDNMEINVPFTVELLRQQRRDTGALRDSGIVIADTVIETFVVASLRLDDTTTLKDIRFWNGSVEPFGPTNDNIVKISLEFGALVLKSLR